MLRVCHAPHLPERVVSPGPAHIEMFHGPKKAIGYLCIALSGPRPILTGTGILAAFPRVERRELRADIVAGRALRERAVDIHSNLAKDSWNQGAIQATFLTG